MFSKILFAALVCFKSVIAQQCDTIFYTNFNELCYGLTSDKTDDSCMPIPNLGPVLAMATNPVTEEFYVVSLPVGTEPRAIDSDADHNRTLSRFSATVDMNGTITDITTPVEIITIQSSNTVEKLSALAFTCEGVPRLFGLSDYFFDATQYLYEIDADTGDLTQRHGWAVTQNFAGNGLYYNIETDRLNRIGGASSPANPAKLSTINPYNYTVQDDITTFPWNAQGNWGILNIFSSYINGTHFVAGGRTSDDMFLASVSDGTYYDTSFFDDRAVVDSTIPVYTAGLQCEDFALRCQETFTDNPSTQPTGIPSTMPSSNPSGMPSVQPSAVPTEMPVEVVEMSTTDDVIMPEETGADSAERKEINLFIGFVTIVAYLFY